RREHRHRGGRWWKHSAHRKRRRELDAPVQRDELSALCGFLRGRQHRDCGGLRRKHSPHEHRRAISLPSPFVTSSGLVCKNFIRADNHCGEMSGLFAPPKTQLAVWRRLQRRRASWNVASSWSSFPSRRTAIRTVSPGLEDWSTYIRSSTPSIGCVPTRTRMS